MQTIFPLSTSVSWRAVCSRLARKLKLSGHRVASCRRVYCDTFDWRLYHAGEMLLIDHGEDAMRLKWMSATRRQPIADLLVVRVPILADDLPAGVLQQRLAKRIDCRALLPMASLHVETHTLSVVNDDGKTVARLCIEAFQWVDEVDRRGKARLKRIRLTGLKGYEKAMSDVSLCIASEFDTKPQEDGLFEWAMTASGQSPGAYTSKPILRLPADALAEHALRQICLQLLNTIQANEEGVRSRIDTEFLHDYRVAVRRTRAALAQIKDVFPARTVERYRGEFAWLGQVTSPARDLDVHLLRFNADRDSLPSEMREAFEPLRNELEVRRQEAYAELVGAMDSTRYRRLVSSWGRFLTAGRRRTTGPKSQWPIGKLARKRLKRLFGRVCREGHSIGLEPHPEELHELRKSCKKLRYLFEFFQCLFPPPIVNSNLQSLKALQQTLGEVQDIAVHSQLLQKIAMQDRSANKLSPETLLAMGTLIANLGEREAAARGQFAADFDNFTSAKNQRRWHAMLARSKGDVSGDEPSESG